MHIHLHAKSERKYSEEGIDPGSLKRLSRKALLAVVDGLENTVGRVRCKLTGTGWAEYYDEINFSDEAFDSEKRTARNLLGKSGAREVWDIDGNAGAFSRLASDLGAFSVCMDVGPACAKKSYLDCSRRVKERLLPLVFDLFNPGPAIGWEARERLSLFQRGPTRKVPALAVIHHLAISNNVPLDRLASFFAGLCEWLIIEFMPKTDSQVKRLLAVREDIFDDYNPDGFLSEFSKLFSVEEREKVASSERGVFLMRRR
jgi:hypothetical protein